MKILRPLIRIIYCVMLIFMALIWGICISGTHHNILWYKELPVTLFFLCGIFAFCMVMRKLSIFLQRYEKWILCVFFAVIFAALYLVSYVSKNVLMYDYRDIYNSAYAFAYQGGSGVNWEYFSYWSNNFPLFFLLGVLMKLCALLRITDPFPVLLFLNVIFALWGGFCVYRLVKFQTGEVLWAFAALLLYVVFPPLWGGTNYFYTDSVSLSFGVWALWKLMGSEKSVKDCILAGILWGMGYAFKATVAISLVAFAITFCTTGGKRKLRVLGTVFLSFACVCGVWTLVRTQFPCYALEKKNAMPFSYWLALGSHNNGSYPDNIDFAVACIQTKGPKQKQELANAYLREHMSDLWDPGHIVSKARYNFASGKMGLSEFNQEPGTFMHTLVNDYGTYGGYATMFASGYFYALLLLGMIGQAIAVTRFGKNEEDFLFVTAQYTVFGLFLFLMIWESNNRQLYNHIPWYTLYGIMGTCRIFASLQSASRLSAEGKKDRGGDPGEKI